jgi:hypothetical protein
VTKDQESGDTHTIWNANKVSLKRRKKTKKKKVLSLKKRSRKTRLHV